MPPTKLAPSPVIIVTGANGGVGFGICQRLLSQLCQLSPPDARPQAFASDVKSDERALSGYRGVTLVMACRNRKRAEAARIKLLQWFEQLVEELTEAAARKEVNEEGEYLKTFKEGCKVEVAELDLASFTSVLKFADGVRQKFPYVSHVVFNAGVASFNSIDFLSCVEQLLSDPLGAITAPAYYSQHIGEKSADNLGWVWQSNLFGHFTLFRELESWLTKSPFDGARVIWSSSLEASPTFYDSEDWQLIKTSHSYESVKYQIDLIATYLDQVARQSTTMVPVRHLITEPGVCSTMISQALIGPFMDMLKVMTFYIGRLCGSQHHTIVPFKAAIAAVHMILVPLAFIPLFLNNDRNQPVRYGAQTDRWGHERVGQTPVKKWSEHREEGEALVKKCDALYSEMKNEELAPRDFERASEKM